MSDSGAPIRCPSCGTDARPGWAFCAECGGAITPHRQLAPEQARTAAPVPRQGVAKRSVDDSVVTSHATPPPLGAAAGFNPSPTDADEWKPVGVDPLWPTDVGGSPEPQPPPVPTSAPRGAGGATAASFGQRVAARLVDGLVLAAIAMVAAALALVLVIGPATRNSANDDTAFGSLSLVVILYLLYPIVAIVAGVVYFSMYESRPAGQTIGKRLLGIRVQRDRGERLSFGLALGRSLANLVASAILWLGQLAMLWNPQRKTWPDRWTHTRVAVATEAGPPIGVLPVLVTSVLCLMLVAGLPAALRSTTRDASTIATSPGSGTAATTAGAQPSTAPAVTNSPADKPGSTQFTEPCPLASPGDILSTVGVGVDTGISDDEPPRLADDPALGMKVLKGRKCTFNFSEAAQLSPGLHLTTAVLIFTQTYTTSKGASAAFDGFRGVARSANVPDTDPFGPAGDATIHRGLVDDLPLGDGGFAYWGAKTWSSAPPETQATTGPGGVARSEIGAMLVEFRVGRTCLEVATNGRIGSPADFPVVKRDVQAKLIELARLVAPRIPAG